MLFEDPKCDIKAKNLITAITIGNLANSFKNLRVSIFIMPDIVTPMVLARHEFDTPTKSTLQGVEFGHIG